MVATLLLDRLTHVISLVYFYTIWKHQKTKRFLFSRGIERDQWNGIVFDQELDSNQVYFSII